MLLTDNRMYELLMLYREKRKMHPKPWKQVLKTTLIILLVSALVACGTVGAVRAYKQHVAKEFLETLYTVTEADLIDPEARVQRLYELADEKFVDELLRGGRIPAVYFHEQNIPMTATFDAPTMSMSQRRSSLPGVLYVPGKVTLHHGNAAYSSSPTPAFILSFDGTAVADLLTPGLSWKSIARAEAK